MSEENSNNSGESNSENSERLRGVVKWFNDAKGFGFIEHTSGKDVFVHYSVIQIEGFKTLKDGEEVEYEIKQGPKGLHAARVTRPNAPLSQSVEVQTIPDQATADAQNAQASDGTAGISAVVAAKENAARNDENSVH